MKINIISVTAAVLTMLSANIASGQSVNEQTATADDWLAKDKLAHLTVSMAAVGFSNHILAFESNNTGGQARAGSISFALSLGLVKEIHDGTKKDNHFSFKDLTADILGIMIGAAIFTGN